MFVVLLNFLCVNVIVFYYKWVIFVDIANKINYNGYTKCETESSTYEIFI